MMADGSSAARVASQIVQPSMRMQTSQRVPSSDIAVYTTKPRKARPTSVLCIEARLAGDRAARLAGMTVGDTSRVFGITSDNRGL